MLFVCHRITKVNFPVDCARFCEPVRINELQMQQSCVQRTNKHHNSLERGVNGALSRFAIVIFVYRIYDLAALWCERNLCFLIDSKWSWFRSVIWSNEVLDSWNHNWHLRTFFERIRRTVASLQVLCRNLRRNTHISNLYLDIPVLAPSRHGTNVTSSNSWKSTCFNLHVKRSRK